MHKKSFILGCVFFSIAIVAFIFAIVMFFEVLRLLRIGTSDALGLIVVLPANVAGLLLSFILGVVSLVLFKMSKRSESDKIRKTSFVFRILSIILVILNISSGILLLLI